MKKNIRDHVINFLQGKRSQKYWSRLVVFVSLGIVLMINYFLIMPAITMEQESVSETEVCTDADEYYAQETQKNEIITEIENVDGTENENTASDEDETVVDKNSTVDAETSQKNKNENNSAEESDTYSYEAETDAEILSEDNDTQNTVDAGESVNEKEEQVQSQSGEDNKTSEELSIATDFEGVTFLVQGDLPEGARLIVKQSELSDLQIKEFFTADDLQMVYYYRAYDISVVVNDSVWVPSDSVAITITSPEFEVADDELLGMIHVKDGKTVNTLQFRTIVNHTVSFDTDGLSTYIFYKIDDKASGGECIYGTNWIRLRDSGWWEAWEDVLTEQLENEQNTVSDSAVSTDTYVLSRKSTRTVINSNEQQISDCGGTKTKVNDDAVDISKTLTATDVENVFDINLSVSTESDIEKLYKDPDVAVVIVMDISNTMKEDYNGYTPENALESNTKIKAAIEASDAFVDLFYNNTPREGNSKIGFVAFNTDGNQICGMTSFKQESDSTAFKNTSRQNIGNIINADNYGSSSKKFTNIEAGLKMAKDMLSECSNKNKYVIFLSDGLPTTYCNGNGYNGYVVYGNTTADIGFRDQVNNSLINANWGGVNYSDTGAIKAHEMASQLKEDGITIFSIGAGLQTFSGSGTSDDGLEYSGQKNLNGAQYILNQVSRHAIINTTFSTVENKLAYTWNDNTSKIDRWNINANAIAALHWEVGNYNGSYHSLLTDSVFENWLTYTIGSGYFWNTTEYDQMAKAFQEIFDKLSEQIHEQSVEAWTVTDPMGNNIEFIGFYAKNGQLVNGNLSGSTGVGNGNTASFTNNFFKWDLKNSGYVTSTLDNKTIYTYTLKYRVRLTNEVDIGFLETDSYKTNGSTILTYQTSETVDDKTTLSEMKKADFPVPEVKGYLGELTFTKKDQYGRPVKDAEFTLTHDTKHCSICKGNSGMTPEPEKTYVDVSSQIAVSDEDGKVTFNKIPSGHTYTLIETKVPDNYSKDNSVSYSVIVSYDKVTVMETTNQESKAWSDSKDDVITNQKTEYQIKLKKIDGTTQVETPLAGAEFKLYTDQNKTNLATHPDGEQVGDKGIITTGSDGTVLIGVLDYGTYYLEEIKAPDGYNLLNQMIAITINPDNSNSGVVSAMKGTSPLNVTADDKEANLYVITITNNPGVVLPSTGSTGTTIFYILGSILVIGAGILLITKKRMSARNN